MKKFNTKIVAEIAIFAAIGYVLDFFQGVYSDMLFPFLANGGSIGIAMIAVFFIAFRHGPVAGVLTGVLMGGLDLLDGFYAYTDVWYKALAQVSLDYVLAYPLAGLAGLVRPFWKNAKTQGSSIAWLVLGLFIGSFMKFMAHFLAGVIFWPHETMNKYLYSAGYNASYVGPSFVVTAILFILIYLRNPKLLQPNWEEA